MKKCNITVTAVLFTFFHAYSSFAQDTFPDLYVDKKTGQVFTEPGQNREKLEPKKKEEAKSAEVKTAHPPATAKPSTTLPDGFAHRPDDVKKEKLTILGRIQYRGVSGSADSPFSNGHRDFNAVDWNFRRLRLGTMYENDYWGTTIQLRLENMLNRVDIAQTTSTINYTDSSGKPQSATFVTNERMKDNRGYVHEAVVFAKIPYAGLRLTAGSINIPFNREYLQSSANFVSIERSAITLALPQFDNGAMITATPLKEIGHKWERYLWVSFMVGNGKGGSGDYGTGRRQDLTTSNRFGSVNISPIYYGRAVFNVFGGLVREVDGKEVNWQEGEEIFQKEMKWSIGTGYAQTQNLITPVLSAIEFNPGTTNAIQYVTAQGSNADRGGVDATTGLPNFLVPNSVTTPGRPKMGLVAHTYDSTFTYKGFYLNGAYSKFTGAASNGLIGYHGTVGYNFKITEKFYMMPVFKYDFIQGDFNRNGKIDPTDTLRFYWFGLNFFGDKHHFKVQLYYQILANRLAIDPNSGQATPIDDRRIYLQVQANFWTGTVSPEYYSTRMN
ncbi:MAG: hypothetical protein K8R21_03155 [Leptospira sp.]|nr:hypothetical protein [Leptospira sp.]